MFKYLDVSPSERKSSLYIVGVIFLLIAIYILLIRPNRIRAFRKDGRITIGKVKEIIDGRGANDPLYEYNVNGLKFTSNEARILQGTYNFDNSHIGKRYFVIFVASNPKNACLLPLNPVPDSIENVPSDGWKALPTSENLKVNW